MKKVFFTLVAMVMVMTASAQKYNLPINEYGDCVFIDNYTNSSEASLNYMKVKTWVNNQGFKTMTLTRDEKDKAVAYTVTKNTKSSYNPFAGQFTEDLIINLTFEFEGNSVKCTFQNMQIQEFYAGYGTNNKLTSVPQMIQNLQAAEKAVADAEASGDKKAAKKVKKENKDLIENSTETLVKASTEIENMRNNLRTLLQ